MLAYEVPGKLRASEVVPLTFKYCMLCRYAAAWERRCVSSALDDCLSMCTTMHFELPRLRLRLRLRLRYGRLRFQVPCRYIVQFGSE